jgi:hypothetical protein
MREDDRPNESNQKPSPGEYNEAGVDVSLLRYMLSLSPLERLRADDIAKPKLLLVVEHLQRYGVEFMVIGGQAAVLHGSPLPTFDIDLCYRRTSGELPPSPTSLKRKAKQCKEKGEKARK